MKLLFKLISAILICTLLLSGCSFLQSNETTEKAPEITSEIETQTAIVTEETSAETELNLNVTADDLDALREMLCGYHYKEYHASTATEEELATLLTDGYVCQGLMSVAKSLTNFPEEAFSQYATGDTVDPMEIFEGSYVWIREDMFDFITQNIFGVTFSHEFDEQRESNSIYYYYEGYFYFSCMITGLEVEDIIIHECEKLENGSYLIKTELTGGSLEMDGEIYHKAYADILASVVETDGYRHWQISEISTY